MSKKKPEPSGDEELSIDELKSVVGGIVEITTTDNQTIKWNLDTDTLSYNHIDVSTRTVKVNKIRRLKK